MKSWTQHLIAASLVCLFFSPALAQTGWSSTVKSPSLKAGDALPSNIFVELAKAINPGVVNISTSAIPKNVQRDPMLEMLERFYGVPSQPRRNGNRPQKMGLGTGFVIRDDGLIVTNAHVIRGADVIEVQFEDGSEKTYPAQVLGSDDRSDIALLKIKPDRKLVPLALGSSEKLEIGEWVAAFGNPFGHGHTMTKGIISSKGRSLEEINKFPLLQTDAPINPGNSGGPLVNMKGEVIGVNSAINAMAQGISFAIPIDEVKKILPQLESKGRLTRGFIGVALMNVESYVDGEETSLGAGVASVDPQGPAGKAGVKRYDIITEFNGKKIKTPTELIDAVSDTEPGKKVPLKVLRQEGSKSRTVSLNMTVIERPDETKIGRSLPRPGASSPTGKDVPHDLGFAIDDLNEQLRDDLQVPPDVKKPVVVAVKNGSVAAFVGIRPGDLILEVNKVEV
ncbi:MAG TPA: trypsin-like peptidase domain-containing protein, partial [Pseudobdellovibrionaceae bacterium]|nr:trypsin-like peptidase domain-containing protein [Pseudobdellovibrionaceae bacterium]